MSRRRGHEATTLIDEPGYRMLDLGVAHSASGESALHIVEEWTIDGRVFSSDTFVTR